MKILYVASNQNLSSYHGGTIHVISVTKELLNHGHDLHLVFQKPDEKIVEIPPRAILHELPKRSPYLLWKNGREIDELLDVVSPDLVIERYYNFAGEAILRGRKRGVKTLLEVNSPMIEYSGSVKNKVDILLLGSLRRRRQKIGEAADIIITPIHEIIPDTFQDKVKEIEWGADTEEFEPAYLPDREIIRMEKGFSDEELLFIHFGSLRKWHGIEKLLEAFQVARSKMKRPAKLVILGPYKETGAEGVHFAGIVPHSELSLWLKMSDIAVLPFSPEKHRYLELGFYWSPLKIFEAMAMELPLITYRHQRLISILGTDDPAFYYDGSTEDLAEKMLKMTENLPICVAAGKTFRQRLLKRYSWQIHGKKLNNWITELVGKASWPSN